MLIDSRVLKHAIATVMPSRTEVFLIIDGMTDAIVRCKDCRHRDTGNWCNAHMEHYKDENWFCADGERKEE